MLIETGTPLLPRLNFWKHLISNKKVIFDKYDNKKHNEAFFTPWTFIHVWSGIVWVLICKKLYNNLSNTAIYMLGLFFHTLYELKDISSYLKKGSDEEPSTIWHNSFFNSIGDTIGAIIGMFLGIYLYKNASNKVIFEVLVIWIILFIALKAITTIAEWVKPRKGGGSCPTRLDGLNMDLQDENPECYFLWG